VSERGVFLERATLTVEEAAGLLGISRNLAYSLAREGKLPGALRLGGRIVVSRRLIEAVLSGQASVRSNEKPI
jgi:excisionase family DNA binding protein